MFNNLYNLVVLLNDGEFHDGNSLGYSLQITRSAIWKMIKKLMDYGVKIDSRKGQGYRLLEPLILLDQTVIQGLLSNENILLEVFDKIDSTNTYLRRYFQSKKEHICIAEQQLQGRGRLDRQWFSPFAQNIYLSYLYHFNIDLSQLPGLSLVISLAVNRTLNHYVSPQVALVKWPNDIWFDHQKLAGILIEVQAENHGHCSAIIGVGINVNMLEADDTVINQAWTSVRKITQQYIDRNELCARLILNINNYIKQFELKGLEDFIAEWNQYDYLFNREITINSFDKKIQGKSKGINASGQLLLEDTQGQIKAYASGDTSIVK